MGPRPAVAATRRAVRCALRGLPGGSVLLVACSGGADSLALLAATVFEARRPGHVVVSVTVDHGLQLGSAQQALAASAQARSLGAALAEVIAVQVPPKTGSGPEAAARQARYAALEQAARRHQAAVVLLGHTRNDQAETVLLGLARGSGARTLAGMPPSVGRYRRPLLGLSRADTEEACRAQNVDFWTDPHNQDPAYARARVRARVLPLLERELGPGVAAALARTARLLRDDADALDELAADAFAAARGPCGLDAAALAARPAAVRRRVLRLAALAAGCPATGLFAVHVDALEDLVTERRGSRGVDLPGSIRAERSRGSIRFERHPVAG